MAFLDNSGDIILDAVLTDTGRLRLARGDGSFKIAKFVFADDEINYGLYDKNNASGSAYYNLDILQTPIFEAFTNNSSVVKSPLLSISRANLLYLPVMKLNNKQVATNGALGTGAIIGNPLESTTGEFIIGVDTATESTLSASSGNGIFNGASLSTGGWIRIDQGLDTSEINAAQDIPTYLKETQYTVELDNRLGYLIVGGGAGISTPTKSPSFIDDDNVASYYFTTTDTTFVQDVGYVSTTTGTDLTTGQVIQGPRGTCLGFQIAASIELQNSTYLFTTLGSTFTLNGNTYNYIDTNLVVRGVTTGASITIPVRFVKS